MRLLLLLLAVSIALPAHAQSLWSTLAPGHAVRAEAFWPRGDLFDELEGKTGSLFLFGQVRVIDDVSVRVELPVAWGGAADDPATVLGNVYLGVTYPPPQTPGVTAEIGIRLPTAGSGGSVARMAGRLTDASRGRPFAPHTLTLTAATTYEHPLSYGLTGRLRGRPMLFIDTGGDTDLVLQFVHLAQLAYARGPLRANVGVGGTFVATDVETDEFSRRFSYELGFTLGATMGRVTPSLMVRLPLDDQLQDRMDVVYGAGVVAHF